jgi:hypothetical protein
MDMIKINKSLLFVPLVLVVLVSSCGLGTKTQKSLRTTSFMPDYVELKLTMDNFEYLGSSEVSVRYNKYIGFITFLHEINEKEVARRNINSIRTYGRTWLLVGPYLRRAMYDAKIEIPEAEIFIPVTVITEEQKMFLGSSIKKTMKVKAYKIQE